MGKEPTPPPRHPTPCGAGPGSPAMRRIPRTPSSTSPPHAGPATTRGRWPNRGPAMQCLSRGKPCSASYSTTNTFQTSQTIAVGRAGMSLHTPCTAPELRLRSSHHAHLTRRRRCPTRPPMPMWLTVGQSSKRLSNEQLSGCQLSGSTVGLP